MGGASLDNHGSFREVFDISLNAQWSVSVLMDGSVVGNSAAAEYVGSCVTRSPMV